MRKLAAATLALCCGLILTGSQRGAAAAAAPETFSFRVVADGLDNPWEITWGPDGYLWTTEKSAGRVTRIRPSDGATFTAATITDALITPETQDGLLGMALHPDLLHGPANQFVYLAYTYDAAPGATVDRRTKIARYTYDAGQHTLGDRVDLLTRLPASDDHDSGRLVFGPDAKLYYTIGDMGNDQLGHTCEANLAQLLPTAAQLRARDFTAYQGKVLRLNLDGSVPVDNPVLAGVRSHVFSYGLRNSQGLVFGRAGRLYSSEQGPKTDDEINLIRAGGNYGWPRVAGFRDNLSYVYADWSASAPTPCAELTFSDLVIPPSVPTLPESSFSSAAFTAPMRTFQTVPNGFNFQDPACAQDELFYICWPTVAPSSLDFYDSATGVPGWQNSLLMTTLKDGTVYRVPVHSDGSTTDPPVPLWHTVNRYRDTAISADQRAFYVATDSIGVTRDRAGHPTTALENPGAILEFRYTG